MKVETLWKEGGRVQSLQLLPRDTTLEAARVQFAVLRRLGLAGRAELSFALSDNLRRVVADGVRHRHPGYTDEQVHREVARLVLGDRLFLQLPAGRRWFGVINQQDLLQRIVQKLKEAGVPYMVAGSLGSSFHGESRATNDIDVVIDPTPTQLEALLALFGEDYYVSLEAAQAALRTHSMFNVIDLTTGSKVDFVIRKDRPFNREEFDRRRQVVLLGVEAEVASPEDIILSKLEWASLGASERQLRDALGVVVVQGARLDRAYLRHWAQDLGVLDKLEELLREADQFSASGGEAPAEGP